MLEVFKVKTHQAYALQFLSCFILKTDAAALTLIVLFHKVSLADEFRMRVSIFHLQEGHDVQ